MPHTPEFERRLLNLSRVKSANLFKYPNVHAYYPGCKHVNGESTGDNCIVVVVSTKKPIDQLKTEEIIPKTLHGDVKTDVIQLPPVTVDGWCGGSNLKSPYHRQPPGCFDHIYDQSTGKPYVNIPGGISIGNAGVWDSQTVGLIVRDRDTRRIVGLTCNHAAGLQAYYPGLHNGAVEYTIADNGFTFTITDAAGNTHVQPNFDDTTLPVLIAGNLYKFTNNSYLHDWYISTNITSNNGGGSLNPYTNITIYDSNGEIRYSGGQGTGNPAISAGETMFLTASEQLNQTALYYGSWVYPNIGGDLNLMFIGVPPCRSTNRVELPGAEYKDGILNDRSRNLKTNWLGHPGNFDADVGGTTQILVGRVDKVEPIKFCHPSNAVQPVNRIDACTFELNYDLVQGKPGVYGLANHPLVVESAYQGAEVFKSGRTTGVTPSGAEILPGGTVGGNTNSCTIVSTNATVSINYCDQHLNTVQGTAIFEGALMYEMTGEWFADKGDSGAALLMKDANDDNRLKLTGLHVASSYVVDPLEDHTSTTPIKNVGIGCNIRDVHNILNLTNWEGTIILPVDDPCVKISGLCYSREDRSMVRHTHQYIDELYEDCSKCQND